MWAGVGLRAGLARVVGFNLWGVGSRGYRGTLGMVSDVGELVLSGIASVGLACVCLFWDGCESFICNVGTRVGAGLPLVFYFHDPYLSRHSGAVGTIYFF